MLQKFNKKDNLGYIQKTTITPPAGWQLPDFGEIWNHRELVFYFVRRDLKSRYIQTALGLAWTFIPPVYNMLLYSVLFGLLAKLPSEGVPYILFLFTGQTAWGFFSACYSSISGSLRSAAGQTAKVYFPRLIVPLSDVITATINSIAMFVVLGFLLIWFRVSLDWRILYLPLFTIFAVLTAVGTGLWITALSVKYRDVEQAKGMLLTAWLYASPVVYTPEMVPDGIIKTFYWLNPMAIVVQGYRWSLLGSGLFPILSALISVAMVFFILFTGLIYFQRVEQTVIDFM